MDRNAVLAFALSFLVLSLWMTWEASNRPQPTQPPASEVPLESGEKTPTYAASPELPPPDPTPVAPRPPAVAEASAEQIRIETSLLHVLLSSRGAGVERLELPAFRVPPVEGGGPVVLVDLAADGVPAFATPFAELGIGDLGSAVYQVVERGPRMVSFEVEQAGIAVRKTYSFDDDGYQFRLRVEVANRGERPLEPAFSVLLPERRRPGSDFVDLALATLVDGEVERTPIASFGHAGFFSSLTGGSPELERSFDGNIEWVASDSHYFLTAIVPDVARDARARWVAVEPGELALASIGRPASLLAGTSVTREYQVYAGPKEPQRLLAAGAQLDRSIQLGWSWMAPVTKAFSWLLDALYAVIPNYGVAIIILTILVKLATAPLASKQMRSMKRMGELQPKMREIQEKFRDDRQRQSQEMMKLYKETGVNPLGGCLPMVLQIPVFIGLYYALQSSIALRQAPFMLWINDLSRPETLFTIPGFDLPVRLLPILMAASMVLQQKMTPSTMDPQQQRMMMVMMPLMMGFMFYTFPSGLVLYWFVSNLLSIAQQIYINRRMSPAAA